jgi:hypothetical protein
LCLDTALLAQRTHRQYNAVAASSVTRLAYLQAAAQIAALRQKNQNLQRALETSRRIGAAIGILMARHQLTEAAAFDALRDASRKTHTKLRDVADQVVWTGELDKPPPPTARAGMRSHAAHSSRQNHSFVSG